MAVDSYYYYRHFATDQILLFTGKSYTEPMPQNKPVYTRWSYISGVIVMSQQKMTFSGSFWKSGV